MSAIRKYPRTPHLEGSRLQEGDENLDQVPFADLRGRHLVVSEKVDGANTGISFDEFGQMRLQSRGHYLTGGPREKYFDLFKQWARTHETALREALGPSTVLYGEWMYARHTIYYDQLPHYFLAYDILDLQSGIFLTSDACREILSASPVCYLLPLVNGEVDSLSELLELVGTSAFKSPRWRERLQEETTSRGLDFDQVWKETDKTDLMEGLYINVEEDGQVVERYKWVRPGFLQAIIDSESHWLRRPIIPNALAGGVEIFGGMA